MRNAEKLSAAVKTAGLDGMMILSPSNRFYATGFQSSAGVALILPEKRYFFTDFRYIEAARERIDGFEIAMVEIGRKYNELVNEIIAQCGIKTIGFEEGFVSFAEYGKYVDELKAELTPANGLVENLRQTKEEHEVESMIKAQRIAEKALLDVLRFIKPGVTEKDIAAELIYRMLKYGAKGMSFDPIVVSGANSSMPHGVPSDKALEQGDFVTMDFGCMYEGYCSDMTRTVAVGYATDDMKNVYSTVLAAQLAGIAAAKAEVIGSEVDGAARKVIADAGYGEYFGHSFGHSLGIDVHESPNASPNEKNPLRAGTVVSAEPGIYLPGKFGVRIEDVIVIRDGGCENITKAEKELLIL